MDIDLSYWHKERDPYWGINETLDYQFRVSTLLSQKQNLVFSYQDTRIDQKWKQRTT